MGLQVKQVENFKALDKDYKKSDGGGLYILIKSNGAKYWRLAYRFNNKQKTLALGIYPDVSLSEARIKSHEAKVLLKQGKDPSSERKKTKLQNDIHSNNTFMYVANEWLLKQSNRWTNKHASDVKRRLEVNLYPQIGNLLISQISPVEVLDAIRLIERRSAHEFARRKYTNPQF